MLEEQMSGTSKMLVVNSSHQEATMTQIGIEATACDQHSFPIDFSSPRLQCKNGFHFYDSEASDKILGARLPKNPIIEITAGLLAINLSQGARVQEVFGQSALSALFQYSFGKRAMDRRQRSPDFIETDVIVRGVRPLVGRNQ